MEHIWKELLKRENVRTNLSTLRQLVKAEGEREKLMKLEIQEETLFIDLLKSEDAKTRKNVALLLGDIKKQAALRPMFEAYLQEKTLFVKAAYLQGLAQMDATELLPELRDILEELLHSEVAPENKKHVEEEIGALRKILIQYEGIFRHTMDTRGKSVRVILLTNRTQRETVRRMIDCGTAKIHPLGVEVETENLKKLLQLRTYRDILFPLSVSGFLKPEPLSAAKAIWESGILDLLNGLHRESGSYYFRIECKNAFDLEERSAFTRKMARELESLSNGELINSTSDYEVELRLISNKEGDLFPCLKLSTIQGDRFDYRKHVIASSIHPSTAALIMELAKDYLKENAQIMDPFCGVGTMLIERHKKQSAREIYGTDIFGEAITFARENTALAGVGANYIHRDFFDFKHDYLFDEIVTNMPLRGKKTKQEMDEFYGKFFEKSKEILQPEAILVMYTNEVGFVKKQLRLHKEYRLLQETCMQTKNDFYLLIIEYKR